MHEISEVWNILDDIYEMDRNDNEEREYKHRLYLNIFD